MYQVAILGCENSHADSFIKMVQNGLVSDVEFVGVYSEEADACQRILEKYGVPSMEHPEDLVGKIDGLIITARNGADHYRYAAPYLASGIPMFIDKPITNDGAEAIEFMRALRANRVRVCGGSCVIHSEYLKKLGSLVRDQSKGEILGGHVRAPMQYENEYGGFSFYAQHLIQTVCTVFGYTIRSLHAFKREKTLTCVFHYDGFDVTAEYTDNYYRVYYASVSCPDEIVGDTFSVKETFAPEFMEFYHLLEGGEQPQPYEEFIFPVFVINAIERAIQSGKEEAVNAPTML